MSFKSFCLTRNERAFGCSGLSKMHMEIKCLSIIMMMMCIKFLPFAFVSNCVNGSA